MGRVHELYSGTTLHGSERIGPGRPELTSYYGRQGPAGQALAELPLASTRGRGQTPPWSLSRKLEPGAAAAVPRPPLVGERVHKLQAHAAQLVCSAGTWPQLSAVVDDLNP